ncbi:hypothetical protein EMEDMD4_980034 [Sinorhizobium medicae]|uniref:Uncharacterized protein n=1 Tax=Sinorhizobium medicae TaxID=110321 RepID=A0A508XCK4_9HYPH|nr:hypothetical protein EMEDMD4_980034 [Sinorhizobium medicae]
MTSSQSALLSAFTSPPLFRSKEFRGYKLSSFTGGERWPAERMRAPRFACILTRGRGVTLHAHAGDSHRDGDWNAVDYPLEVALLLRHAIRGLRVSVDRPAIPS